jgi:hypothetical protein
VVESDHLLSIAGAVADGADVVWADEAARASDPAEAAVLAALRDLQTLWSALRRLDARYDETAYDAGNDSGRSK